MEMGEIHLISLICSKYIEEYLGTVRNYFSVAYLKNN